MIIHMEQFLPLTKVYWTPFLGGCIVGFLFGTVVMVTLSHLKYWLRSIKRDKYSRFKLGKGIAQIERPKLISLDDDE